MLKVEEKINMKMKMKMKMHMKMKMNRKMKMMMGWAEGIGSILGDPVVANKEVWGES